MIHSQAFSSAIRSGARRAKQLVFQLAFASLFATSTHAAGLAADEDSAASMFSFSGFGTLGVVHSSEDDADFVLGRTQSTGAGAHHSWAWDVDSRIGGQVTATFTPRLSAVVQLVAEQRYDDTYKPNLEWANIKYDLTPDLTLRVGRVVLGTFLVSDYRKVGYATPWVRPPLELYDLVPVSYGDGVNVRYRLHAGEATHTLEANVGSGKWKLPPDGEYEMDSRNGWYVADTVEYRALTLHASYAASKLTVESASPFFDAFRMFGPQGEAIADKYDADDKNYRVFTLGANYDPGRWFAMGEWGTSNSDSFLGRMDAWYVSAGYRVGRFTPYAVYGRSKMKSRRSADGLDIASLPPFLQPAATELNAGLNWILAGSPQKTISLGVRWDFARNAALKLQYDHTRLDEGSYGALANFQPDFTPGSFNVYSATVDFVF